MIIFLLLIEGSYIHHYREKMDPDPPRYKQSDIQFNIKLYTWIRFFLDRSVFTGSKTLN